MGLSVGAGDARAISVGVGAGGTRDCGGTGGRLFIISILALSLALLICDVLGPADSELVSGLGR